MDIGHLGRNSNMIFECLEQKHAKWHFDEFGIHTYQESLVGALIC